MNVDREMELPENRHRLLNRLLEEHCPSSAMEMQWVRESLPGSVIHGDGPKIPKSRLKVPPQVAGNPRRNFLRVAASFAAFTFAHPWQYVSSAFGFTLNNRTSQ